jgi:formylglycine-generating enzyme required for sulfatase activity
MLFAVRQLHLQIAGANFQLAYGSQSPVTALPASEAGFHDVFGNAWEWAEDHFAAFHGFKVHPYYEDFSAPCFGGLHHMVSGCNMFNDNVTLHEVGPDG